MKHALATITLATLTLLLTGCNIVGPAYYFIHGPEKTKKLYALDKEKSTVVFIDDRENRVPRRTLRLSMAQQTENTLLKQKVLKDMVSANSALTAAGGDRHAKPIPVAEIGKAVQADIVIFAAVDLFTLTPDGNTYAPEARLRVKVISAADDKRLWPDDPAGYPLRVRLRPEAKDLPTSVSARYAAEDELAKRAGLELAWLFFNHEKATGPRMPD
jgi:hypothetical protein